MSVPPFQLLYTREAEKVIEDLAGSKQYATKLKQARKALRLLQQAGPRHPGLHSHDYQSVPGGLFTSLEIGPENSAII
ncbi:MAG: hypothetical protein GEU83_17105 [Pseudonocardiaceae bacterium]|nr:hypothetical protein [Pseudonocardiaceae bacterium]